jgi:hypothetical protein
MTYESWRISYQSSEQAARAAWEECERLRGGKEGNMKFVDYDNLPIEDTIQWLGFIHADEKKNMSGFRNVHALKLAALESAMRRLGEQVPPVASDKPHSMDGKDKL